jgi:hypothetical protein
MADSPTESHISGSSSEFSCDTGREVCSLYQMNRATQLQGHDNDPSRRSIIEQVTFPRRSVELLIVNTRTGGGAANGNRL